MLSHITYSTVAFKRVHNIFVFHNMHNVTAIAVEIFFSHDPSVLVKCLS